MKRDKNGDYVAGLVLRCGGKNGACRKLIYKLSNSKLYRNLSDRKPHSCYPGKKGK